MMRKNKMTEMAEMADPSQPPEPTGNLPELLNQLRSYELSPPNPNWTDTEKRAWCLYQLRQGSGPTMARIRARMGRQVELPGESIYLDERNRPVAEKKVKKVKKKVKKLLKQK